MRILRIAIVARTTVKDQDGKYSANYIENDEVKKVDGSIHAQQVLKKIKSLVELPLGEVEAEVRLRFPLYLEEGYLSLDVLCG